MKKNRPYFYNYRARTCMKKIVLMFVVIIMAGCSHNNKSNISSQETTSIETKDEPQFVPCDNFIQVGKNYKFDSYNTTSNCESSIVFSNNTVSITTPYFHQQCEIVNASYYKNTTNAGYYYADLEIMFEDELCEARFSVGPTSRSLSIYYPKPSRDIHYVLDYSH